MNVKTLMRLPEETRELTYYIWRGVYRDKDIEKEEGFQFIAGMMAGLLHAGVITDDEQRELFSYYRCWFPL